MTAEQWLLSVFAPGGILAALVTLLGVVLGKRQDKATKKAKAEVTAQSSAAQTAANDAKRAGAELEKRIKDLELREKEAQRNFRNMEALRAQYKKLDQRAYELEGQNKAQAVQMEEMREHGKLQDQALFDHEGVMAHQSDEIEGLKAWREQAIQRMDETDAALAEALKLLPDGDRARIEGLIKTPRPNGGKRPRAQIVNGETNHETL